MNAVRSPASAIALSSLMMLFAVGVGWWRFRGGEAGRLINVPSERWERVQEQFPLPGELSEPPQLGAETFQHFIDANPFSPQRRFVPSPSGQASEGGEEAAKSESPVFAYKGRVNLGARQRVILEDMTSKKTHFLEVGQEVAGYKVLDILEDRVLLSEPQTNKEIVVQLTSKEKP